MNQEHRGSAYAILSGLAYGLVGYFGVSAIHGHLSAETMLFWRFFIASLLIFIVLLPQIKKTTNDYPQMLSAFLSGVFYYGISTWLYFLACAYISSGLAMVLLFTYPLFVMLLNFLVYKQTIPKIYYLAISIIFTGMFFLVDFEDVSFNLWGIFLSVVSSFCYAGYVVVSKRNTLSPHMSTLMVCLGCMVTSLVISLVSNTFIIPSSPIIWMHLFGIALIATVIPILLMFYSLEYISSEKTSILSVLEPVFVVFFGMLLLGETLQMRNVIGMVLILIGALMTLFSDQIKWIYWPRKAA